MKTVQKSLNFDELPATVARHYWEEDIKRIDVTEYEPEEGEDEEKTAVMMIRVQCVKPRPNCRDGVHRWQRYDQTWEYTG